MVEEGREEMRYTLTESPETEKFQYHRPEEVDRYVVKTLNGHDTWKGYLFSPEKTHEVKVLPKKNTKVARLQIKSFSTTLPTELPRSFKAIPEKAPLKFFGPMPIPYWIITALSLAFIGSAILSDVWMLAVGGIGLLLTIFAALRDIRER